MMDVHVMRIHQGLKADYTMRILFHGAAMAKDGCAYVFLRRNELRRAEDGLKLFAMRVRTRKRISGIHGKAVLLFANAGARGLPSVVTWGTARYGKNRQGRRKRNR